MLGYRDPNLKELMSGFERSVLQNALETYGTTYKAARHWAPLRPPSHARRMPTAEVALALLWCLKKEARSAQGERLLYV
jgi:hypothetical protein